MEFQNLLDDKKSLKLFPDSARKVSYLKNTMTKIKNEKYTILQMCSTGKLIT